MARKDALLKLYRRLQSRRDELRRALADDLTDLQRKDGGHAVSDDADAATESLNAEMSSQLAQLESRELMQIERALRRLREGKYGVCEACGKKIPVARLNALPYSTLCIACQRDAETNPTAADSFDSAWQKVYDTETASKEVQINLTDFELNIG